jgi:mannose PTS system EIIA component
MIPGKAVSMKVIDSKAAATEPDRHIGGVIVTHGHLASEFIAAAEMIVGPIPHVTQASVDWHDDVDVARQELERAIARVSEGRGVLLLTDMFGGAPTDIASMFLGESGIEVVTGVNLPMILKLAGQGPDDTLEEIAKRVRDAGTDGIHRAGELLARPPKKD